MSKQFLKYLMAGVVNTVVGYGVFLVALRGLNWSPEAANALGYAFGLCVAFLLNRFFVFVVSGSASASALRFIVSFALAFAINQAALFVCYRLLLIPAEIAQIFAMVVYTVVFYLLNKHYAFRTPRATDG